MNYGYSYNPYNQQQRMPMYQPSSSGFGGIGAQIGGGLKDAYKFSQQEDAFQTKLDELRSQGMSEMEIDKYASQNAPGFLSNPRGYMITRAGEGIVSGAKMAGEGIMEGAGKVGGALKGLGSSL